MSFFVEQEFGHFRVNASLINREDIVELANLLATANSPYLREFGLEIESELMEVV